MSWFKRRSDSKASQRSSDASSTASDGTVERRSRCDTDPDTCLEVFRNHWEQATKIIDPGPSSDSRSSPDEIQTVSQNFEQMVTLLADEEGEQGQGMPGPILHFLLEHEILEKFCGWCHRNNDETGKLVKEQLRMFEHLISQSHQLLLIHKPVIRPLLNLLAYCGDDIVSSEVEASLVLVLHQICISISKEKVILESFFNMNADHGPTKFLIFSLLIPYLHREGSVGQQARDALLLIMALSAKHPYIGQYIAENSDFCPVLATGLSGLYSDLPRKIEIAFEDWYQITDEDVPSMPAMAMFLNSLVFCNAVSQIAHPLVRDQLIKFIYNGFLVPVLGPALHQNSREEVITATAYLDLFLRKLTEPSLIKAFLEFIFTEKNDEIVILDSLVTRINSSSKLCLVSLSLFHTLADLNCEDVMYDLIFKHLIPCTHVMVSQRRSVRDQDVYSKSAEKFLSLRPTCCLPEIDSPKHNLGDLPGLPTLTNPQANSPRRKLFRTRKEKSKPPLGAISELKLDSQTSFPPGTYGSKLEHFETSYMEYLHDAHHRLTRCSQASRSWQYPYDGENPPPTCLETDTPDDSHHVAFAGGQGSKKAEGVSGSCERTVEVINNDRGENVVDLAKGGNCVPDRDMSNKTDSKSCDIVENVGLDLSSAIDKNKSDLLTEGSRVGDDDNDTVAYVTEEEFVSMLEQSDSPRDRSHNVEESMKSLESMLSSVSAKSISLTSTPRKDRSHEGGADMLEKFPEFNETRELSSVYFDCETSKDELDLDKFKSIEETSFDIISDPTRNKTNNATEFEIVDSQHAKNLNNNNTEHNKSVTQDATSFIDISAPVSETQGAEKHVSDIKSTTTSATEEPTEASQQTNSSIKEAAKKGDSEHKKGDKSVRFAEAPVKYIHESSTKPPVGLVLGYKQANTPNIGPFLMAVMVKLEGMMQNSLSVNLMLTGLISRLACYAQPLLRSFLLNHNLVFQPTVKSLVQVLTSVRQKVDHYSYTVQNFEVLLLRARRTMAQREGSLPERAHSLSPSPEMVHNRVRASTIADIPSKEKRHRTLTELLFRKTPNEKKALEAARAGNQNKSGNNNKLEILGNRNVRFVNRGKQRDPPPPRDAQVESTKTRNAVYCAIVLEEFVKELAALTQEHSVLYMEEDTMW